MEAKRDQNRVTTLLGVTDDSNATVSRILVDATTGRIKVSADLGDIFVDSETPTGTIDGSNKTFTLANTPTVGSVKLYLEGVRMDEGNDYTILGAIITFVVAPANIPFEQIILADYRK